MKYINKNTGDSISREVYIQLNEAAKSNFIEAEDVVSKTHSIIETKNDSLSAGDAVAVVVLSPIIMFKALFG